MTAGVPDEESLPLSVELRIDAVCGRFEAAWQAVPSGGPRPAIEAYLGDTAEPQRAALLRELLALELDYRKQRGERPTREEYRSRFPEYGELLETLLDDNPGPQDLLPHGARDSETAEQLPGQDTGMGPEGTPPDVPSPGRDEEQTAAAGTDLPRVPGYEVRALLGRGGMGVVYQAWHLPLKRPVALKMILGGALVGPEHLARFQTEAEAAARLRHANIVQIHAIGERNGLPFLALEFVDGGSLHAQLAGNPLDPREAAHLVEVLARAVHAAHRARVVHRDLKPANVLLARSDPVQGVPLGGGPEGLVYYQPKVSDFGLAKLVDAEGRQTVTGAVLGTPCYMAPEMARGDNRTVGPAADVYGLGAILYECLTGRPPFKGGSYPETLEQVRTARPPDPSRLRPGLSRRLEAACLKCLAKEPAQRYPSAEALANDLRAWLDDRPMTVQPPGLLRRLGLALRRRPRRVAVVALTLLLAVSAWAAWVLTNPDRPINRIEAALARGEAQTLIGEMGRPAWSRCAVGDKAAKVEVGRDGTLFVNTWSLALLELVRDPQCTSYRLSAQVRHDAVRTPGEVGIYVGHRKFAGDAHSFVDLSFNDISGHNVHVGPHLYRVAGRSPEPELIVGWPAGPMQPAGLGQTDWRRLGVEVRPGGICALWEGEPIGAWTAEELAKSIQGGPENEQNPEVDPLANLPPDFAPRGALGLYVKVGSASFRRVVLEPLDESH
jgi:serine/threonine-protein kinase